MGKIFLGIPHGGPETLQAAVLLEPDPEQGSRKEHTVPTQDQCGFTKDHTEGKVERGRGSVMQKTGGGGGGVGRRPWLPSSGPGKWLV
jgi:hypothetical protein